MPSSLDTRQLATVVAVARSRSFTEAAKSLHLTQSAVSHAIKGLENEIGHRLFERDGRRIQPTEAGEYLIREATEILARLDAMCERIGNFDGWGHGRLRIGAAPACAHRILPSVIREFRQSFPECAISVLPGHGAESLKRLRRNEVDLVLAFSLGAPGNDLESAHWFDDELALLLPPYHPLARKNVVPVRELAGEVLHLAGDGHPADALIEEFLQDQGVRPSQIIEAGSVEAMTEMVKIGQGIALAPAWLAESERPRGALAVRPLAEGGPQLHWRIYWHRAHERTLGEEAFVGLCLSARDAIARQNQLRYV